MSRRGGKLCSVLPLLRLSAGGWEAEPAGPSRPLQAPSSTVFITWGPVLVLERPCGGLGPLGNAPPPTVTFLTWDIEVGPHLTSMFACLSTAGRAAGFSLKQNRLRALVLLEHPHCG